MKDYTTECWSCGSKAVLPIDTWFKCDDCGATHVIATVLGPAIVESGNVFQAGDTDKPTRQANHPTPGVKKQARLAREAKGLVLRSKLG